MPTPSEYKSAFTEFKKIYTDFDALIKIPLVGKELANNIIKDAERGQITKWDDLLDVPEVGPETVSEIIRWFL